MAKPLTRAQALQNRAFLKALGRTGNLRLACREVGLKYGTIQHRRRSHPAFALRCEAALASAQARLLGEPDWLKRRRGESREAHSERLAAMAEERDRRAREAFEVAEVVRRERGEPAWGPAGEAVLPC
jgi:hypothetical protein